MLAQSYAGISYCDKKLKTERSASDGIEASMDFQLGFPRMHAISHGNSQSRKLYAGAARRA
jgi:hypothetical protein